MHIHRYEKIWMSAGFIILGVFLATIAYAAVAEGIQTPAHIQTIDPTKIATTPPFDKPGLRRTGSGEYDAYYVAHVFAFDPPLLRVPTGSTVTFYVTSPDVVHDLFIINTDINLMVVPGWVSAGKHTFRTPGTYLIACTEYCGAGHQLMAAKIEVK